MMQLWEHDSINPHRNTVFTAWGNELLPQGVALQELLVSEFRRFDPSRTIFKCSVRPCSRTPQN